MTDWNAGVCRSLPYAGHSCSRFRQDSLKGEISYDYSARPNLTYIKGPVFFYVIFISTDFLCDYFL